VANDFSPGKLKFTLIKKESISAYEAGENAVQKQRR
jgi:hypothetical protein